MKKTIIITSLFLSLFSFAQESVEKENLLPLPKMSYLDSLKTTFVNHSTSNCIDERWLSELASIELSDNMFSDISNFNADTEVSYELSTDLLKKIDLGQPIDSLQPKQQYDSSIQPKTIQHLHEVMEFLD